MSKSTYSTSKILLMLLNFIVSAGSGILFIVTLLILSNFTGLIREARMYDFLGLMTTAPCWEHLIFCVIVCAMLAAIWSPYPALKSTLAAVSCLGTLTIIKSLMDFKASIAADAGMWHAMSNSPVPQAPFELLIASTCVMAAWAIFGIVQGIFRWNLESHLAPQNA